MSDCCRVSARLPRLIIPATDPVVRRNSLRVEGYIEPFPIEELHARVELFRSQKTIPGELRKPSLGLDWAFVFKGLPNKEILKVVVAGLDRSGLWVRETAHFVTLYDALGFTERPAGSVLFNIGNPCPGATPVPSMDFDEVYVTGTIDPGSETANLTAVLHVEDGENLPDVEGDPNHGTAVSPYNYLFTFDLTVGYKGHHATIIVTHTKNGVANPLPTEVYINP